MIGAVSTVLHRQHVHLDSFINQFDRVQQLLEGEGPSSCCGNVTRFTNPGASRGGG